jgi:hypothetical protein
VQVRPISRVERLHQQIALLANRTLPIAIKSTQLGFLLDAARVSKSEMAELCANHTPNIAVGFRYTKADPRTLIQELANPRTCRVTNRARKPTQDPANSFIELYGFEGIPCKIE